MQKYDVSQSTCRTSCQGAIENSGCCASYIGMLSRFLIAVVYLVFVMMMAAISIFLSIMVLRSHHKCGYVRVPKWLYRIAFERLAPKICNVVLHKTELDTLVQRFKGADAPPSKVVSDQFDELKQKHSVGTNRRANMNVVLEEIRAILQGITAAKLKDRMHDLVKHEWHMFAKVLDRVLLILFLATLLFFTFLILLMRPIVY